MPDISVNLAEVQSRIASALANTGRSADLVKLIAVSKTISADRMIAAIRAGVTILGENRVQEAKTKYQEMLVIYQKMGNQGRMILAYNNLGDVELKQNKPLVNYG
mgnify:CR=1 FL=1